jgi:hypothetical protein
MWVLSIIELALLTQLLLTNFSLSLSWWWTFLRTHMNGGKNSLNVILNDTLRKAHLARKANHSTLQFYVRSQAVLDQIKTRDIKTSICSYSCLELLMSANESLNSKLVRSCEKELLGSFLHYFAVLRESWQSNFQTCEWVFYSQSACIGNHLTIDRDYCIKMVF